MIDNLEKVRIKESKRTSLTQFNFIFSEIIKPTTIIDARKLGCPIVEAILPSKYHSLEIMLSGLSTYWSIPIVPLINTPTKKYTFKFVRKFFGKTVFEK